MSSIKNMVKLFNVIFLTILSNLLASKLWLILLHHGITIIYGGPGVSIINSLNMPLIILIFV